MDMAREELGLVWMGDMLLQSDPMLLDHQTEPSYFSESQPTLDDLRSRAGLCVEQPYAPEIDGFMMLGEFEDPYCNEVNDPNKYSMTTAATQTNVEPRSRKIKPIKHPGLKLQTPIAYQRDTDPSVIPIQRDGMAVCEKCGAIGVKHAFYTKERRFCSMQCARGTSDMEVNWSESMNHVQEETPNMTWDQMAYQQQQQKMSIPRMPKLEIDCEKIPPLPPLPPALPPEDPHFPPDKFKVPELQGSFDWTSRLNDESFLAVPVSCFRHAPMSDCWDNITTGMKVEVENYDCENFSEDFPNSFWVATVLKVSGYKAQLRYEGFGNNSEKDFWVNLCSSSVHPVGWCATRGKPLIPPRTIEDKYRDWKDFLVKRLTGARTLPSNFYNKVHDSMRSRFRCDLNLEVVDKNRICQIKVATIKNIVGKRLHITYYDTDPEEDGGFWCHEDSPLIHPVGWARRIGQDIDAPRTYMDRCYKGLRDKDDATEDLFPIPENNPFCSQGFQEGMKLEAVDPLNLSAICVASVMKVLNEGYIMIRVDSYEDMNGSDWFCYHMSSPYIFPVGFCCSNNIPLSPPKGWETSTFSWQDYLLSTHTQAAPVHLFNSDIPNHGFVVGMKLEAVDLMEPRLVCVATISRVIGRLMKIHFDGWEDEYDQWLDCCSPDMYPVGWCQLVAHKLEAPPSPSKNGVNQLGKGGRPGRKRRRRMGLKKPVSGMGVKGGKPLNTDSPLAHPLTSSSQCDWLPESATGEENLSLVGGGEEEMILGGPEPSLMELMPPEPVTLPVMAPMSMPVMAPVSMPVMAPVPVTAMVSPVPVPAPVSQLPAPVTGCILSPSVPALVNEVNGWSRHVIPRLIDGSCDSRDLVPHLWSVMEVAEFLRVNDCGAYSDVFVSKGITGEKLLQMTNDDTMHLTGMKMGPSLKINDLIYQLKIRVNPAQERMKAGLKKHL